MAYQVPAVQFQTEYLVKKSRFIARVVPVEDRADVSAALAQARLDYPDARHHCWAYLLGRPEDASTAGMSDDGEPAGTAGRPILNVLQHGHLGDVLVVVIRYFGGIKLGAGGLVRAYSTATQLVVDATPAKTLRLLQEYTVTGDFSAEQPLRHFLSTVNGELLLVEYGEGITVTLGVDAPQQAALLAFCAAHSLTLKEV